MAANATGVHLRHYQGLEAGSVNVTLRTIERLCRAFAVDVRELFGRE
jgi:transcriptional regulator with XRE-family HTH domain